MSQAKQVVDEDDSQRYWLYGLLGVIFAVGMISPAAIPPANEDLLAISALFGGFGMILISFALEMNRFYAVAAAFFGTMLSGSLLGVLLNAIIFPLLQEVGLLAA